MLSNERTDSMSNTKTGGPAFPVTEYANNDGCSGMTLRDYFAAKAMHGIIASRGANQLVNGDIASNISFMSFGFADAMLKAREA